ncbi:MAG TPA: methyltransferase domain-containing protein [Acidobacteriota bacterium]
MTWSIEKSQGNESRHVVWDLVPYMRGEALDLGCGPYKALPHFIGIDSCKDTDIFGIQMRPDMKRDVTKLPGLASGHYDCVYSSHTLEHVEDHVATLREWWRLVKVGGYLCLYLPHADFYPRCKGKEEWDEWCKEHPPAEFASSAAAVEAFANERRSKGLTKIGEIYAGTPFANPDHKSDFLPSDIINAMKKIGGGFDLVENEERNEGDEYSFWQVYKKITSGIKESWKEPKPAKTCAVIRYGAQGDHIISSSIYPWLKEQGYHITLYCQTGLGYEVVKHDPHIDRFILQERDAVPPQFLGEFWGHEKKKYDKWVNLCESVEGTLLACPDRVQYEWPNHLRAKYLDRNYLEWTHELAEVPPPYRPKFYSTETEKTWARQQAAKFGKRNVLWSLAGSSGHKVWPHVDAIIAGLMLQYPDVHVVTVGDEACELLEQGWGREPRVHCRSGKWRIRESLAFAEVADLIIGTETGLLNAAGSMDAHKIITLSHSSENMLTRHWVNTTVLKQPDGIGCSKRWTENGGACRQLHGGNGFDPWKDCPKHEGEGVALCQYHVGPEMMWGAVERVLGKPNVIPIRKAA